MRAFKYSIIFNPNYFTCFHNILENLSCKDSLEICNLDIHIKTLKHETLNIGYTC
jgi:hypothetical protein